MKAVGLLLGLIMISAIDGNPFLNNELGEEAYAARSLEKQGCQNTLDYCDKIPLCDLSCFLWDTVAYQCPQKCRKCNACEDRQDWCKNIGKLENPTEFANCKRTDVGLRACPKTCGNCANKFFVERNNGCAKEEYSYEHHPKACVNGANLVLYPNLSVDDCKMKCNERDDCLAFEYGVPYGGRGSYKPKDCQLQSSKYKIGCDGTYHNLDLYVKKVGVKKIRRGTLCSATGSKEMTSENKCKAAGEKLGLVWAHSWNGPNDFPGCLHAEDGRNRVYFNTSPHPRRTNLNPKYAAICEA